MKIILRVIFFCWLLLLAGIESNAQITPKPDLSSGSAAWKELLLKSKRKAVAPGASALRARKTQVAAQSPVKNQSPATTKGVITNKALVAPACLVPVDASFTALPRGDGNSSDAIHLPFSFNLYGTTYNEVYINTDGTISFTEPIEEYLPIALPYYQPVIAPFWGDVDTRHANSGQVYYKVTPTHLIVTWDHVGYADQEGDKLNTFQVIIGVPGDELLGPNTNLKMNYGDMQWTTAYEAGDFPALVGINGDFFQYYQQIGRFGKLDDSYDGPGGQHDGIQYLANKCFSYDVRTLPNLPPQFNYDELSRVIELNVGQTIEIEPFFTAPEAGQTVTTEVLADEGSICKLNYTVTNGPTSRIKIKIEGDPCNAGFHFLYMTATDNGHPQQVTTATLLIWIKQDAPVISFPLPVDEDGDGRYPLKATASNGQEIVYNVLSGPGYVEDDTLITTGVGSVTVRAFAFNESAQTMVFEDATVCVPVKKPGAITGDPTGCLQFESIYQVPLVYGATYHWTVDGVAVEAEGNEITVLWSSPGSHQIAVSYSSDCSAAGSASTLAVQVISNPLTGSIGKMLPSDGNTSVSFPLTFSWFPVEKAVSYDIYVWPAEGVQPKVPLIKGITDINHTLYNSTLLEYGKPYKWRVVARGVCALLESAVQTFQLRHLPDLTVNNVQAPATAFSGQSISLSWQVRNAGQGATLDRNWLDRVYLSTDLVLDEHDISCISVANTSALNSGGSYTGTATFNLPNGLYSKYYFIVAANDYDQLLEKDDANNLGFSATPVNIQLTPPPDLQVSTVTPPNNAFSGQLVEVIWTVNNDGIGKASGAGWMDVLYLTKEAVLDRNKAVKLGMLYHGAELTSTSSYTQKMTVRLPDTVAGNYYVHVVTDWADDLYEHAAEDNNTNKSGIVNIIQAPPVDLVVQAIEAPAAAAENSKVTLRWKVGNAGGAATNNTYWRDAVYLSTTPVFNAQTAIELSTVTRSTALNAGEFYPVERTFLLPRHLAGTFYVAVQTDVFKEVFEYEAEHNNIIVSPLPMQVSTPDLSIAQLTMPVAGLSGQAINIHYTLKNNGSALENTRLTDRILISKSPAFDAASSTVVKLHSYATGRLEAGRDTGKSVSVVLPEGIAGSYYLYVQTDVTDTVYETNQNNNTGRSVAAIEVSFGPWADLQVSAIAVPDQAAGGALAAISYTVVNKGNRSTNDSNWTDRIYVSQQPTWDAAKVVLLRTLGQQAAIDKDSMYRVSTSVMLPGHVGGSDYYLFVVTNAGHQLYEHKDSNNNTGRSKAFYIKKYPPVDIVVGPVIAPASGQSGMPLSVQWTVQNKGEAITLPGQWTDAVYLSADTVWDGNDQRLQSFVHRGDLPAQGAYTSEQTLQLPNGLAGRFYLLVVADPENVNYDAQPGNNYGLVRNGGQPVPIGIVLTPPADLVVTKLTIPDEGFAGQPLPVKWVVQNKGTGATNKSGWTEKIFLSKDIHLDPLDVQLGAFVRKGALAAGAQYQDSMEVLLPMTNLGNHVLIFQSDANDNVYEHNAEENLSTTLITIVKDELSDLVVTDVQVPASAQAGEEVMVKWKVRNTGTHPANGFFLQSIFLSADDVKDVADVLVGSIPVRANLAPGGAIEQSMSVSLKGVSLRPYYALVHADVQNNMPEVDENNNISPSRQPVQVAMEALEPEQVKQSILGHAKDKYYRFDVPDSLVGASLLITLQGDTAKGDNGMYVRYGDVAGMAVHDLSGEVPYQANQEIIIPALRSGTYYVLVHGRTRTLEAQSVSVKASVLHFDIRTVEAKEGGNTGEVTVLVQGAKLNTVRTICLQQGSQSVKAARVEIINPTSLYARIDLQGVAAGVYDVVAENIDGDTAVLPQSFTVVAGTGAVLSTSIVSPPNARPSNVLSFQVAFANTGHTDIINPVVRVTSLGGAPIALKPGDIETAGKTLTLHLQEVGGPAGRLRPGAKGTVIVYAKATTVLGFMLMDNDQ
ncbi:CARDB domain-containing protein [Paraflavitalea pollutisoli]|uniref:CARDB domain-containing protein n=1 Tax=Paraflavitalea pollutisoli TaxID=3034143 RepID=UPI0023ECD42D|nr:CARDB domain-containing protein [Paraflavitalea sp. H1-2-19X]